MRPRPEVIFFFQRWGESLLWLCLTLLGLWIASLGGMILIPLGLLFAAASGGWALLALRRARFHHAPEASGLVEIIEGGLRYLHPTMGGEISLAELDELRLITLKGRKIWQLKDLSGRTILVPIEASGADALFDALGALTGLSTYRLLSVVEEYSTKTNLPVVDLHQTLVWTRQGTGLRAR